MKEKYIDSSSRRDRLHLYIWMPKDQPKPGLIVQMTHGMVEHMRKHADIIRPKFEAVEEILERELGGLGIGEWTKPKGGYFIAFDSMEGCA